MPTRREARVQAFCPKGKTLAQAEFSSAEQVKTEGGPQGGVPSWGVFRPGR